MNLCKIILLEVRKTIEQERMARNVNDSLKNLVKLQKKSQTDVWVAKIYTKYGGSAIVVYSFAPNATLANKEFENLPHFRQFSERAVKKKLDI